MTGIDGIRQRQDTATTKRYHPWTGSLLKAISTKRAHFCSPRSPDLTPLEFYLWGFVKDENYFLPMGISSTSFKEQINGADLTLGKSGHAYSKKLPCLFEIRNFIMISRIRYYTQPAPRLMRFITSERTSYPGTQLITESDYRIRHCWQDSYSQLSICLRNTQYQFCI